MSFFIVCAECRGYECRDYDGKALLHKDMKIKLSLSTH